MRTLIKQMPTLGELWMEPLPTLFKRVVAFKVDEARWQRSQTPWLGYMKPKLASMLTVPSLHLLGWMRSPAYQRLRVAAVLYSFSTAIDHAIDPTDIHSPDSGSGREHFNQATKIVEALQGRSSDRVVSDTAYPEMVLIIYAFRACVEVLGVNPSMKLQSIWRAYTPDVLRVLDREIFADKRTLDLAVQAFMLNIALVMETLGVPASIARQASELCIGPMLQDDQLADFLDDLLAGNIQVPRKELEDAGICIDDLLLCETYDDLAELVGFADWFYARALYYEQEWARIRPDVEEFLLPHVKPWCARLILRRRLRKIHRDLRIERERYSYDLTEAPLESDLCSTERR